jgi:hypothetical protein
MPSLVELVESRLTALFQRLADGDDAPPGQRLRLEGLLEAVVYRAELSEEAADELIDTVHRQIFGDGLTDRLGDDWRAAHPFPELPVFARRAPVSTGNDD